MKNVFIDLGSHYGAIIKKFIASKLYSHDFQIHAFEANVLISGAFAGYPSGVTVHKCAASTIDGDLKLYINTAHPSIQGSSIYREKITGDLDKDNPIVVPCIDFSKWIRESFSREDNIIIKSNIEGAEYGVFGKMIDDGSISFVKRLYLRLHWHKIGMAKEENDAFMARLRAVDGLHIQTDYEF
jgi:FkbM family methyltransferase